jgi:hypothetical protein
MAIAYVEERNELGKAAWPRDDPVANSAAGIARPSALAECCARRAAAGLSLPDIRAVIATPAGPARRAMLREHRDAIRARIADLQAAHDLLDHAVRC